MDKQKLMREQLEQAKKENDLLAAIVENLKDFNRYISEVIKSL